MSLRLSVCLATYCGEKFVREQIDSVLSQLDPDDEFIISDDGSTDRTLQIVESYRDSRLRIVNTRRCGGVVANFEVGLASCTGDIIALCDQDDVWLPGRVALIKKSLEKADCIMLDGYVVDGELRHSGDTIFGMLRHRDGVASNLLKSSFIGCCMAFHKKVLKLALPFPKRTPWHDWYIGLIATAFFHYQRIEVPSLMYRRHGGNASATGQVSTNSLAKKLSMRLHMIGALAIASHRKIKFGDSLSSPI